MPSHAENDDTRAARLQRAYLLKKQQMLAMYDGDNTALAKDDIEDENESNTQRPRLKSALSRGMYSTNFADGANVMPRRYAVSAGIRRRSRER